MSSFYGVLVRGSVVVFSWKSIWATESPSKVTFFVWTVVLGQILTINIAQLRLNFGVLLLHCLVWFWCNRGRCWVCYKIGVGLGWGRGVGRPGFLFSIVCLGWCGRSGIGVFFRMSAIRFHG